MIHRIFLVLLAVDGLLGVAHLLWPKYEWGQGRESYFHLDNPLTLASWLVTAQLVAAALLAVIAFHRRRRVGNDPGSWAWPALALGAVALSIVEMTRAPQRLELVETGDPWSHLAIAPLLVVALAGSGRLLWRHTAPGSAARLATAAWLATWGTAAALALCRAWTPATSEPVVILLQGWCFLLGGTFLLRALAGPALEAEPPALAQDAEAVSGWYPGGTQRKWILLGVAGCTFTILFLQILLFQLLTIFGDYVTANTVIPIALLGIAVGGLVGFFTAARQPVQAMAGAALLLPLTVLGALGTVVSLSERPLLASLLLMAPFVCASIVITVALARGRAHLVYSIDLLGAAAGTLGIAWALDGLREESSLLLLCAFTLGVAACFVAVHPSPRFRRGWLAAAGLGAVLFTAAGCINLSSDWLNVVRTMLLRESADTQVLFSRSSLVGRYDVIRTSDESNVLKTIENGRTIDTIRDWTEERYQIDPRLPHNLIERPVILILGLSGDAITKTAKLHGREVWGLEINPAIVELQTNELVPYNGDSYRGIRVVAMDGRTFVEQGTGSYDMITLLNAHFAKGDVAGRAISPEFLQTREAFGVYLERLTDRGVVIIEEPVGLPRREPPVWKLLQTMRQALVDRGATEPQRHFFVFQWKTRQNNYYQILMKKTPFTGEELGRLKEWLAAVDGLPEAERAAGRQLGPIGAITTLLYSPGEIFGTNVAQIVEGRAPEALLRAHHLVPTTDDRPFPFDVDPGRREVRQAYGRTLVMALLVLPLFVWFLRRHRGQLSSALPLVAVVSLTGVGYLMVEIVLIQRYGIYLGSPVIAFTVVLGGLLVFSGLGSLWSGRIGPRGLALAVGGLFVALALHALVVPQILSALGATALAPKVLLTLVTIAPLALLLGIPFPYVLNASKRAISEPSAAMLFAINAALSALAAPLALIVSVAWGMRVVLFTALAIYATVALCLLATTRTRLRPAATGSAYSLLAAVLLVPWFAAGETRIETPAPRTWELYGLSIGSSGHREDQVVLGGSNRRQVPFEWMYWVARGPGRTVLVDTGFDDPELVRQWRVEDHEKPTERLAGLGIRPDDVTDVVLTHLHWDHAGGLAAFPRARVWLQQREYDHAAATLSAQHRRAKGMRWEDLETLRAAEREGRLTLVDGESELAPGLTMTFSGGHTPGMQYVTVATTDGPVVIAGDTTYLYWNNQRHVPIGTAVDPVANLRTIRELHRRAASPFLILPGHDPRVMRWFPDVAPGIVRVTSGEG